MSDLDVIIIGGGPAGLLAAIRAAREGARVIVCEQLPKLGAKLREHFDAGPQRILLVFREAAPPRLELVGEFNVPCHGKYIG